MSYGLSITTVPKDLYYVERKLVADQAAEIERLRNEVEGEREGRNRLDKALRQKDEAMGVLFDRLAKAGVDCSDLIS